MKTSVVVKSSSKEYPELTKDQIKKLVLYLNGGMSEEEAYKEVLK
jgi:hypothetical protein